MRKLLGSFLLSFHALLAFGQTQPTSAEGWQNTFFNSPGTAIPLLISAAAQHSAQLKTAEVQKSISQQDLKLAKKNILGALSIGTTYNYGNQGSFGTFDPNNPNTGVNTFTSSRYSVGVNLGLSVADIANRKHQIKREELNYQRTEFTRQEQENQLRQEVITLYQSVLLARKLLTLQQEAYVTAQSNYRLAERQFRQGQLLLPEVSDANTKLTGAAIAQETALNQYNTAFMLLEELTGAKISSLMTTR